MSTAQRIPLICPACRRALRPAPFMRNATVAIDRTCRHQCGKWRIIVRPRQVRVGMEHTVEYHPDHRLHGCGGTILTATGPDGEYGYCIKCVAYAYGAVRMPSGTDRDANREAWRNGEDSSPESEGVTR